MVQRSLTTGVSQALYDEYRASLPEGESVNSHLRALIERWLAGPIIAPGEPPAADPAAPIHIDPEPWYDPGNPPNHPPWPTAAVEADPGCMHPRGALKREGRSTVCTLCGRHLSVL